ncbi:hypothetical protein, partial [Escherichia coli]|uniref:hypothetical protein n=1 Tax=Escherichia coli TaxID=562 RepID=UPI001C70710B
PDVIACWHYQSSMRWYVRRTASKPAPSRNPFPILDVQVFLSSIIFVTLLHSSRPFNNAQKMLSNLDNSALSEKVSRKYFW